MASLARRDNSMIIALVPYLSTLWVLLNFGTRTFIPVMYDCYTRNSLKVIGGDNNLPHYFEEIVDVYRLMEDVIGNNVWCVALFIP